MFLQADCISVAPKHYLHTTVMRPNSLAGGIEEVVVLVQGNMTVSDIMPNN